MVVKPKPWRMDYAMMIGLVIGGLISWMANEPASGWGQNLRPVLLAMAMAILVVGLRNKRKKVGPYDPETIARNERGRI